MQDLQYSGFIFILIFHTLHTAIKVWPLIWMPFLCVCDANTAIPPQKSLGKDAWMSKVGFYSVWTVFSETLWYVPIAAHIGMSTCCDVRAEMVHTSNPTLPKIMEEPQLLPHQFNSSLYGSRKLVSQEWRKGCLLEELTVGCEGCCKYLINLRNLFNTVSPWHSDWINFLPMYLMYMLLKLMKLLWTQRKR